MAVRPEDFGATEVSPQAVTPEQFGAQEDRGILQRVSDFFTGADRETAWTRANPVGAFTVPESTDIFDRKRLNVALGMMTSVDDDRRKAIIKENYPKAEFVEDEKGNVFVDLTKEGGHIGLLNPPGVDPRDLMQLGGMIAAFTPAGRLGAGAGWLAGALRVGAASGATQAALDVANQALGGTAEGEQPGVQLSDISLPDVALAALGGAGGEMIGRGLARLVPALRRAEAMPVDNSVKAAAKSALDDIAKYENQFGPSGRDFQLSVFRQQGISDDIANMILDEVPPVQAAEAAAREADQISREFRIPYSAGQRTGSPAQLQAEEAFRAGGSTAEAQQVARSFEQTQKAAIEEAVRRGATQAGSAPVIGSAIDAAETATSAVKSAAQQMDEAVKAAYDQVPKGTFFRPAAAQNMIRGIRKSVRDLEFDRTLPATQKALNDVSKMEKALSVLDKKNARVPFNVIEQYRRKLNGYMKGSDISPTDQRQVLLMKQALDEYTDRAVADGLLFGADDAAGVLGKVENARALRRLYAETFEPQPSKTKAGVRDVDPAGRLINKMAELEPDAGEISSALFGSGSILGRKESAELVKRVGNAIGRDSPEFQQIKQAAFLKIFGVDKGQLVDAAREGPVRISGAQALRSLQEVIGGRSKGVAKELFSKEEIDGMVRLARAIKRAQPEPFNPSGTAGQINAQFREQAGKLMNMLGFTAGPIEGALINIAQKGVGEISDANATALARQVFSGRPLQVIGQRVPGGAVGAPAMQSATQATQQQGPRPR